jgi:hypothetical protein
MGLTVSSPPRTKNSMFAKYTLNCLMIIGARSTGANALALDCGTQTCPAGVFLWPQRIITTTLTESFHSAQVVSSHLL